METVKSKHITPKALLGWIKNYSSDSALVMYGDGIRNYHAIIDTLPVQGESIVCDLDIEYDRDKFRFFIEGERYTLGENFTFMSPKNAVLKKLEDKKEILYLRSSSRPVTIGNLIEHLTTLEQDEPILYNPSLPGNIYLELTAISEIGLQDARDFINPLMPTDLKEILENFRYILYFYIRQLPFSFSGYTFFKSHIPEYHSDYYDYTQYLEALVRMGSDNVTLQNPKCEFCHNYIRPAMRIAENGLSCSLADHEAGVNGCEDFMLLCGGRTCKTCLFNDGTHCTHCRNVNTTVTALGEVKIEYKKETANLHSGCELWRLAYNF